MQEVVGENKNVVKEREKKILFSTLTTKLTVEEDTVAYKEMKQMSHEGILEILNHVRQENRKKPWKSFGFPQLRRLR